MNRLSKFAKVSVFSIFLMGILIGGLMFNAFSTAASTPHVVDPDLIPWIDPVTGAINVTKVYSGSIDVASLNLTNQLWWGLFNRTDILAHPQDSFNFLVYSEGGLTYARTGNTWQVTPSTIQACVDAVTSSGGSIIVKNGTYSEAVSLKNATRLVLDRGCVGVTVTIASGATAICEDYNAAITWVWSSGVLVMQYNNINGAVNGLYSTFTNFYGTNYFLGGNQLGFVSPATFIIDVSGGTYRAWHGANSTLFTSSTNASAVINNAIGNASSTKGSVCFAAGTFVTQPFNISANMNVYGQGVNVTIIQLSAVPTTTYFIASSANTGYVTLHDLTVDGQGYHNNVAADVDALHMSTYQSRYYNLEIRNCSGDGFHLGEVDCSTYDGTNYISDTKINHVGYVGLHINTIDSTHVTDIEISNTDSKGIYVGDASPDNYFLNCHVWSTGGAGVYLESRSQHLTNVFSENAAAHGFQITASGTDTTDVAETVLTNCRSEVAGSAVANTYDGFHIDGISSHLVRQVHLIGCVSDNYPATINQRYGVYIGQYTDGIEINGGVVAYNAQNGIYAASSNGHRIANVELRNNGQTGAAYQAIQLAACNDVSVQGCYVTGADWGIQMVGVCDRIKVIGNTLMNNGWGGIGWDTGTTGSVISDNVVNGTVSNGILVVGGWDCTITGNTIGYTGSHGIYLSGGAGNTLSGNAISFTQGTKDGIYFSSSSNNIIEANVIHDNTRYGINIALGSNNTIQGNRLFLDSSGEVNNTGTGTCVHYNVGFVTENSGTWTGTTGVAVAHGLAGIPTVVGVDVNAAQPYTTGWTANATHIVIYHNGLDSLTGSWSAEYKP